MPPQGTLPHASRPSARHSALLPVVALQMLASEASVGAVAAAAAAAMATTHPRYSPVRPAGRSSPRSVASTLRGGGGNGGGDASSSPLFSSASEPRSRSGRPLSMLSPSALGIPDPPSGGGGSGGDPDDPFSVPVKPPPDDFRPGRPRAIVVGGGPVGLASALLLSTPDHAATAAAAAASSDPFSASSVTVVPKTIYDVTVYETTPYGETSTMSYDPTKAFLYNVNVRGQSFTEQFPDVQAKLEARGVPFGAASSSPIVVVPGDPSERAEDPKKTTVGGAKGAGASTVSTSYWIPRHEMVTLLYQSVMEHNVGLHGKKKERGKIEYVAGTECVGVRPVKKEGQAGGGEEIMEVTIRDKATGKTETVQGELVIGADGWKSAVRDCLLNGEKDFGHWPDFDHKRFKLNKWISPASGLKIKVLQFPPKFKIPNADRPPITTTSTTFYSIRSVKDGQFDRMSFGLLPMTDDDAVRPINVITRPNHQVWELRSGEEAREWFQEAFPRLPFGGDGHDEESSLVSDEEWERFASAEGTTFPPCQVTAGGLAALSPNGECGVALVGDAVHAFPPDIGQGINAGLVDAVWLDRAMRGEDLITGRRSETGEAPATLGEALSRYQKERGPEVKALVKYSRFGAPYQYGQPLLLDRIGKILWTANFMLRFLLNKVTFGLFPQAALLMAQDANGMTFRKVMRRADAMTAGLWGAAAIGAWRLLRNAEFAKRLAGVVKSAFAM